MGNSEVEDMSQGSDAKPHDPSSDAREEEYFTSYEDVEIHRLMVNDGPRTDAYLRAIQGNAHLFRGKVAMDIGAGSGILSLFIAAAGARKVYAVEASAMADVIRKVAQDNGFGDVIHVMHSRVEDVELPEGEKVDVIVSEWMGFYLLHESMLNSVIKARDKFLSEDGTVFPSEARIYACPCSLKGLYKEQLDFWNEVYGFDMKAVRELALKSKMTKPEVCLVSPSDLLSEPKCVRKFNLRWVTEDEVQLFSETTFVGIKRAGAYQGLCLWFDCDFDGYEYMEDGTEVGTLVTLSTAPSSPATHWKQTVVVLGYGSTTAHKTTTAEHTHEHNKNTEQTQQNATNSNADGEKPAQNSNANWVEEDEVVGWKLVFSQSDSNARHYTMTVEMLDPESEEHPVPCSCPMPRCLIIAKMMEQDDVALEDDVIDCV